jgi:hypothetical protein
MTDQKGESVFENVDELLTDKIINHTFQHTEQEDNVGKKSDKTNDQDTYCDCKCSDYDGQVEKKEKSAGLMIIIAVIAATALVIGLKSLLRKRK